MYLLYMINTLIMKFHFLTLFLSFLLALSSKGFSYEVREVTFQEGVADLTHARALAEYMMEKAALENKWRVGRYHSNRIFENALERFRRTEIRQLGPESRSRFCSAGALAYTLNFIGNDIYLCPRAQMLDEQILAQVLVHEVGHLILGGNECVVTQFELLTSIHSPKGVVYRNGYWDECRIDSLLERVRALN